MSSPIPALNPARCHDHPIPVAAVVPLSRRAQQSTDAPAEESLESVALPEERADPAHELPDDLPVADGNLFVAGSVVVAPRAMPLGNALPLPADTRGPGWRRPDDAAAGAGRTASGRYVLPMRAPAEPPAAKDTPVVQAQRRLPPAERPAHAAPQPDTGVPGGDDNPGHAQLSPLRTQHQHRHRHRHRHRCRPTWPRPSRRLPNTRLPRRWTPISQHAALRPRRRCRRRCSAPSPTTAS